MRKLCNIFSHMTRILESVSAAADEIDMRLLLGKKAGHLILTNTHGIFLFRFASLIHELNIFRKRVY